ncbi:MAG: HAMP domain-containing sensor histidine kinase [Bacillota bacterium]|nr:HAMP domain-containing sensor histidine kinase [Bacillota bacterium]
MSLKKRSLFLRIFSINLLVILLSLIIISSVCYVRLNAYLKSEHENSTLTAASKITDMTQWLIEMNQEVEKFGSNSTEPYNINRFKGQVDNNYRNSIITISSSTNLSVLRISPDKRIIFRYADIQGFNNGALKVNGAFRDKSEAPDKGKNEEYISDNKTVNNLLSGKGSATLSPVLFEDETYYIFWGNMDGLFKETNLTVAKPLYINGTLDSLILVFIATPQINSIMSVLVYNFLAAAIVALTISLLLSYGLSYRISLPLKAMNEAAMKLGSGHFSERVNADDKKTISEIHELITTFNDMAEAIEHLEENQRSFTASISHELRTPMTSIIGFIECILDGTIPEDKVPQYLEICLTEAKRLSNLVNSMMDASRVESGMAMPKFEKFDINECIRQQLLKYEDPITKKGLEVVIEFFNEKCDCYCDKDEITRVIINLLDNAIKFADDKGYIKIKVDQKSGKAVVSIENSGEGISSLDIKHIFDKFYKTDKSRSLDKKGIGLGLYLVKNILVLHDETIECTSIPGQYTRFTFTLKLYKSNIL